MRWLWIKHFNKGNGKGELLALLPCYLKFPWGTKATKRAGLTITHAIAIKNKAKPRYNGTWSHSTTMWPDVTAIPRLVDVTEKPRVPVGP